MEYPDLQVNCVTFGSPRVGCSDFVELFNHTNIDSIRYVNDNDPVPCLPTSWRFQHVNGCHWLYQDTLLKEIKGWRFWRFVKNTSLSIFGYGYNALNDHSCTSYLEDLHKLYSKNF